MIHSYLMVEDSPTLAPSSEATLAPLKGEQRVPTLTILWHPDTRRIGDSAPLKEIVGGRTPTVECFRARPGFLSRDGRREPTGLDDPSVSSKEVSFSLSAVAGGRFEIRRGPAQNRVAVDDQPLEVDSPRLVDADGLERGVVILLGDVALYLGLAKHPRPSSRAEELHGIVGVSDEVQALRDAIVRKAQYATPLFLRGESGAGKGVAARALHAAGPRATGPFVSVNLANVPRELVASTLYGHERGAFTGAASKSPGYFVEAQGGTLFLDEIGAATMEVQVALLKAIEDREIWPVGASRPRKVDVRVLAATDADLAEKLTTGSFSRALFERLIVDEIRVPPLREHRQDVGLILTHCLQRELRAAGEPDRIAMPFVCSNCQAAAAIRRCGRCGGTNLSPWLGASAVAAIVRLTATLPGNVRRLATIAHQIVDESHGHPRAQVNDLLSRLLHESHAAGFPLRPNGDSVTPPPQAEGELRRSARPDVTAQELRQAFEKNGRSVERMAADLGLSRSTAYRLAHQHGLVVKVSDDQVLAAWAAAHGDVDQAAAALNVPRHHFKQLLTTARRTNHSGG